MGLFRKKVARVPATAVVQSFGVGATTNPDSFSSHPHRTKGSLHLMVTRSGEAPYAVDLTAKMPSQKLPAMGDVLPVLVHPDDPSDVVVDWDRVPTILERATQLAADAAEARRTGEQVGRVMPPEQPPPPAPG